MPKQERIFGQHVGTRMRIPFSFGFPDLVVHTCGQELVKRPVHYKMLLQTLPHSLLLGHIPLAPSILLIPECEGRSCPSPPNGEEMGRAGQGRAKITSIPCIQNLLLRATATKMIWRENKDFFADCSLKTNCTLPFVIHSGFKAACE